MILFNTIKSLIILEKYIPVSKVDLFGFAVIEDSRIFDINELSRDGYFIGHI